MVTVSLTTSSGATRGAGTVAKMVDLRLVSVTDHPTNCVVGLWRQGVDATASIGTDFCEKVSWPRSGVLLWGPIPKRELRTETMARCTKSIESRYQARSDAHDVRGIGDGLGLSHRGGRCGFHVEDRRGCSGDKLLRWTGRSRG